MQMAAAAARVSSYTGAFPNLRLTRPCLQPQSPSRYLSTSFMSNRWQGCTCPTEAIELAAAVLSSGRFQYAQHTRWELPR